MMNLNAIGYKVIAKSPVDVELCSKKISGIQVMQ
jgi:hypothetical protein